jgi:hypothetical protein
MRLSSGVQLLGRGLDEVDAVLLHQRRQLDGDVTLFAPADADPGVGGGELETFGLVDENDPVVLSKLRLEVEHHGDTAKTGAENNYVCIFHLPGLPWPGSAIYI